MSENKVPPHGGNIYKAALTYGLKLEDILDYSANINPFGLPTRLKELLAANLDNLVNYPDPDCTQLKNEISRYLGIDEDRIVIGNGASEVIFLLFEVLKLKRILIPAPSFIEYTHAAVNAGIQVDFFRLREEDGFKLSAAELKTELAKGYDALLLCNPNNPTSTLLSKDELKDIISFAAARGLYVIIDEAFIELTEGGNANSMADTLEEFDRLFIIRAFTKLFAMPGLRLGYGLGNRALIEAMWRKKLPWSVNSLACCAGEILNDSGEYLKRTGEWIAAEKIRFYNELSGIPGLKTYEPQTNFVLLKILDGRLNAGALRDMMAKKGILIRDASNFKYLDGSYFRLAIKDRESNLRLLELLKSIFTTQ